MAALADDDLDWPSALGRVVESYAQMFRTEPGFRWLRLGDEIDRNVITTTPSGRAIMASLTADLFVDRYQVDYRVDLVQHVEVMIELADALIARAFLFDLAGDDFFLEECTSLLVSYLGHYLAQPYDHEAAPSDSR